MTKAYSYTRFSTPGQLEGGSLTRQLDKAAEFARSRGLDLDDSLRDLGRSAYAGEHRKGALGAFLAMIERGQIPAGSYLIIEAMDRLSREEVLDALALVTGIVNAGICLVTLEDGFEYTRDRIHREKHLMYILLGKFYAAHQYSARLSERVLDGKAKVRAAKLAAGLPISRMCPAWLRVVEDKTAGPRYEPIPDRVKTIGLIYDMLEQGLGRDRIVSELNRLRRPTFDRAGQGMASEKTGQDWYSSYIVKLINNAALVGDYTPTAKNTATKKLSVPAGAVKTGVFPVIIDRVTFERHRGVKQPPGRRGAEYRNLLTGLVNCLACGSAMMIKTKGIRWPNAKTRRVDHDALSYLVCSSAVRNTGCTARKPVPYLPLEARIIKNVAGYRDTHSNGDARLNAIQIEIANVLAEKKSKEDAIKFLMRKAAAIGDESIDELVRETIAEKSELEQRLNNFGDARRQLDVTMSDDALTEFMKLAERAANESDKARRYKLRSTMAATIRRHIVRMYLEPDSSRMLLAFAGGETWVYIDEDESRFAVITLDGLPYAVDRDDLERAEKNPDGTSTIEGKLLSAGVGLWAEMRGLVRRPGEGPR
ncbi:MAG: recombinase family protein [Acetobacteraceae bacterium]